MKNTKMHMQYTFSSVSTSGTLGFCSITGWGESGGSVVLVVATGRGLVLGAMDKHESSGRAANYRSGGGWWSIIIGYCNYVPHKTHLWILQWNRSS